MSTQFDNEKAEAYDEKMELHTIKVDLAVLKETCATKAALAELGSQLRTEMAQMENRLKTQIAETKSTIIIWVVGSVFLAQLLPALLKYFLPLH